MTISRRNLGVIIIVIGLLIIALIIYFGFWSNAPAAPVNSPATPMATTTPSLPIVRGGATTPGDKPTSSTPVASSTPAHQTTAADLSQIALAFAERFGSFSNQSGYSNISDLEIYMTDSMQTWAETYIQQLSDQYKNNGAFYSITTHALLSQVSSFNDKAGTAVIVVTTKRSVAGSDQPYDQKLDLRFRKVNGDWLVDNAHWEK